MARFLSHSLAACNVRSAVILSGGWAQMRANSTLAWPCGIRLRKAVATTSPFTAGATATWPPQDVVRIVFQSPFVYTGGTLCVYVVGRPVIGQSTSWWMADAAFEDIAGTLVDLGGGCGIYGGAAGAWSSVQERSLLAGGHARFFAHGTPLGLGVAAFGSASPTGMPLPLLGLAWPPGCELHLATLDAPLPAVPRPRTQRSAVA